MRVPFGGWTLWDLNDPCSGGHVIGTWTDQYGMIHCYRCSRLIDKTPCWCGSHSKDSVQSRSYCQQGIRADKKALRMNRYYGKVFKESSPTRTIAFRASMSTTLRVTYATQAPDPIGVSE